MHFHKNSSGVEVKVFQSKNRREIIFLKSELVLVVEHLAEHITVRGRIKSEVFHVVIEQIKEPRNAIHFHKYN